MWDERYSDQEYAYGTQANDFLREKYRIIPKGKVLCLAEGEGRNAVFLSQQGYSVTAVDLSKKGIIKAEKLAESKNVKIEYIHADLLEFNIGKNQWDGVVSIFVPLPLADRKHIHQKVIEGLKDKGVYLLEAYTPNQLQYGTGGGNCANTMQTEESIIEELGGLHLSHITEIERNVTEGKYHTGLASVVQAIGTK